MVLLPISFQGARRLGDATATRSLDPVDLLPLDLWGTLTLPPNKLFGTDGIRGKAGQLLTAPLAAQIGFWAGQVWQRHGASPGRPVIIGQDSRNSSDMLAIALTAGLTAAGLEVWNLGLCPTPAVAYLTHSTAAIGGIMISASHNPPEDNGIKFFGADGTKLGADQQAQIEVGLRSPVTHALAPAWHRYIARPDLLNDYLASLRRSVGLRANLAGMKVVLDLAWGAAVALAPVAFERMGATVLCLHDRPDGDRINVNCGSTHLAPLQAAVLNHNADLGFAFDGDADRVIAVDGQGRVVDGDYILYLWGQSLRQAGKLPGNAIVTTVMANLGFERAWEAAGGVFVRTPVGDQHVHAEMVRRGAMLGGEQSGHVLCPHYGISGDGTLTALHLAMLVRRSGGSLANLVDQSFQTYPQVLKNVRVEDPQRRSTWQDSEELQRAIAHAESEMGDRGRVLVRASGTEPVIRVMVEAASLDLVEHWTDYLVTAVQRYAA
ncbi:MAG: phosphoglucosamine mutase [Synechococcales bacterium]|nr:phosphoglucosamine mutase [Synechococcales bacterium]